MNNNLIASSTISINSTAQQIWDVLTNPEKVKVYLYGTKIKTDWIIGNSISFEGKYEGKKYYDKGVILDNQSLKTLTYSYWSSFSGLKDSAENYSIISYKIEAQENGTCNFTWHQQGFVSEDRKCHTEQGLIAMLKEIKKIAEQ